MREFESFAKSKQLKNKTYYASLWSAICMISFASLLFFLIHTKALIAYIDQLEIIGLGIFFSIVCLLVLLEMPMLKRLPRIKFLLILNFCILSYLLAQLLFLL